MHETKECAFLPYSGTLECNSEKSPEMQPMLPIENSSPYQKENQGMYAMLSALILQNI